MVAVDIFRRKQSQAVELTALSRSGMPNQRLSDRPPFDLWLFVSRSKAIAP
jgi:hypothetical protein